MAAAILLLLLGVAAVAGVLNAARPLTRWWVLMPSWMLAWVTVELGAHLIMLSGLAALLLVLLGALEHAVGVAGLVLLALADAAGLVGFVRALRTRVAVRGVMAELDPEPAAPRFPRSHVVFPFLMLRRRGVTHDRGLVYWREDGGRPLKLDVYRPVAAAGAPRPAIINVHGGGWVFGTRKEQGIPLLNHLAAHGWVGFNIDYRLSPFATWPEHAIDVKRAIAWVRAHAADHGVDPSFIALTGGSAGGHITAFVALTAEDRSLQPGFEQADCSVQAAVPFYGVYDMLDEDDMMLRVMHPLVLEPLVFKARRSARPDLYRAASPRYRVHAGAPPFFVIHGDRDSLVPAEDARRFVRALRDVSRAPVLHAEMRGAQHAFDLIPSARTAPVVEAIERFLHVIRTRPAAEEEAAAERALT